MEVKLRPSNAPPPCPLALLVQGNSVNMAAGVYMARTPARDLVIVCVFIRSNGIARSGQTYLRHLPLDRRQRADERRSLRELLGPVSSFGANISRPTRARYWVRFRSSIGIAPMPGTFVFRFQIIDMQSL